jgi:glyoxylase-like metal-dependent hydrolase (beta-lactamase superfamily II)
VRCRWPASFTPTPTDYSDGPIHAFDRSHALTSDGAVRLVPTPGHTHGHQSVIVQGAAGAAFLAGDASFSRDQVERRAVAGICEDRASARRTLDVIAEHLAETGATYLPSHAPDGA